MRREFMVERQGRWFVLYAGLLDEAHAQGLKSIQTQLVQVPGPENGQMAICSAQVETDRGTYSGLGDASPESVSRMMLPHLIRMAETRAKARALRDAINCGAVALEELADTDDASGHVDSSDLARGPQGGTLAEEVIQPASRSAIPRTAPQSASSGNVGLATPNQVRAIYLIGRDQRGLSEGDIDDKSRTLYGRTPAELSRKQASELITTLKASKE